MRFYYKVILGLLALAGTVSFATTKHIPIPATNANQTFSSLSALETAVAAFASNFSAARSTYGVPTGEPVLQLTAGNYGDLNWSNYNLPSRITVRGSGPYSHDGYAPTAGTKIGTLRVSNCSNIRFMGFQAEPSSIATTFNNATSGDSNHRIDNGSQDIEIVRCALNGDVARSTAALSTAPKNGVTSLVLARNSDDCKIMHSSLVGFKDGAIGLRPPNTNASANGWEVRGNVIAQGQDDGFVKMSSLTMNNWIFADNLGMGKGRDSDALHRDIVQIFGQGSTGTAQAVGWVIEGNWCQSADAWGSDKYPAKQGFWWGSNYNTNSQATIQNNFFGLPGAHIAGTHGGATVKFNTGFTPLDTLGSDRNDGQGIGADKWTGNIPAPTTSGTLAFYDENIFPKKGSSAHGWTGTNGAAMNSDGFVQAEHQDNLTFDWDVMGAFLANYDDTYSQTMVADYDNSDTDANNGKYQVLPREGSIGKGVSPDYGVEMYKPATGSRAHWDHADPTGCFELFERVFDENDHDHWKDWGWPTAVTAHIYYDPNNAMGGASGDYDTFDANGDYSTSGGVSVTGVSLSSSSISIYNGSTSQLTETVSPSNATNKNVSWMTSNSAVATVSSSGLVSAVGTGSATITVTTVDGSYTDTCSVTVSTPPGGTVVIDEEFSGGAGNFTEVSGGTWGVSSGRLTLSSPASGGTGELGNVMICDTAVSSNSYTAYGTVQASSSGGTFDDAALVFGYQDSDNYYFVSLNESDNENGTTNGLFVKDSGGQPVELADFSPTYTPGVDHDIEVIRSGSSIVVKVDSTQVASVADSTFTGGKFGFGSKNDGGEFDDLLVQVNDTEAPSVPTGLASNNVTTTSVGLSWNASSDNVGVTGYKVYTGGSNPVTVMGTITTISGLSQYTSYTFTVSALDEASNESSQSSGLSVTTVDGQAPSVPTGLASSNVGLTSVDLDWNASSDNVGVSGYKVYTDGSNPVDVGNVISVTMSQLTPSTNYAFTVTAYDAAGNESAESDEESVTTSSGGSSSVISENFSVSAANFDEVAGGAWSVSSGRYVLTGTGDAGSGLLGNMSVHNTVLSGDYTVSGTIQITGTGSAWDDAALIFGYQDSENYYYVALNESNDGNTKGVFKVVNDVATEMADISTSIVSDTDYTVEVVRTGSSIVVNLNSAQIVSITDATFSGGQVGFGSKNDAAEFDDLTVDGTEAATTYVVIQSEDATLSSVTVTTAQTGYTGTGFVDYPFNGSGYVEYSVNAPSPGEYIASTRYANGDSESRYLDRTVNGSGSISTEWPDTGAWNSWSILDDFVTLTSGTNTIRYSGQGSEPGGANPDKMTLYYPDVYQAEDATLSGGATAKTTQTGYTGTGFVDYPTSGGYVEFSVTVPSAGSYLISLRYANGDTATRTLTRTVNSSGSTSVDLPSTGAWNAWGLVNDTVTLGSGSNTIRFTGPASPGGANPDKITLYGPLQ